MKTIEKIGIIGGIGILIYLLMRYTAAKKPAPTPTPTQPTYPTQPTKSTYPTIPTEPQKYIKSITIKPEKTTVYVNEPLYIDYEITPNEGVEPPETIMGELIMMRVVNILSPGAIKAPKPVVKEVILNPHSGKISVIFDKLYGTTDKYNIRLSADGVNSNLITICVKPKIIPTPTQPTRAPVPTPPYTAPTICSSSDPPSDPPPQNEIIHNVI